MKQIIICVLVVVGVHLAFCGQSQGVLYNHLTVEEVREGSTGEYMGGATLFWYKDELFEPSPAAVEILAGGFRFDVGLATSTSDVLLVTVEHLSWCPEHDGPGPEIGKVYSDAWQQDNIDIFWAWHPLEVVQHADNYVVEYHWLPYLQKEIIYISGWHPTIPEPTTVALLGLGALALLRKRRA